MMVTLKIPFEVGSLTAWDAYFWLDAQPILVYILNW